MLFLRFRRLGFDVFKWSLFICIVRYRVVVGWFLILVIVVLGWRIGDLLLFRLMVLRFIIGDVFRIDDCRVSFVDELFLFLGMVIDCFVDICLFSFL